MNIVAIQNDRFFADIAEITVNKSIAANILHPLVQLLEWLYSLLLCHQVLPHNDRYWRSPQYIVHILTCTVWTPSQNLTFTGSNIWLCEFWLLIASFGTLTVCWEVTELVRYEEIHLWISGKTGCRWPIGNWPWQSCIVSYSLLWAPLVRLSWYQICCIGSISWQDFPDNSLFQFWLSYKLNKYIKSYSNWLYQLYSSRNSVN
jgi:hypothetical protein